MKVKLFSHNIYSRKFSGQTPIKNTNSNLSNDITNFCESFQLPNEKINHAQFDENLVKKIVENKQNSLNLVVDLIKNTDEEKKSTAGLFLLNRLIDSGVKNVGDYYHVISKHNYTDSPNIQTMLAGVYRKTLVPDAFGPMMTMFWKNSQNPKTKPFDANEEIGGAILEYLRKEIALNVYKK
jgi:hypothetical protein